MSTADEFPKHPTLHDAGFNLAAQQAAPPSPSPHKNLDPITSNCADCGATREEIDDGLAQTCYVHTGPHVEALRAIARTMRRQENEISQFERNLAAHEAAVAHNSRHLRTAKAHLEELKASFEKLRNAP